MKVFALMAALAIASISSVFADELDNEAQIRNAARAVLPQTLVVRVDAASGDVAVFHSKELLDTATPVNIPADSFVPAKAPVDGSELDQDSSSSGWYFHWNHHGHHDNDRYNSGSYYYYPSYYCNGYNYNYNNYYNYYWGGYNYYWYRYWW